MCVSVRACACARACVHACVRECVCVCVCVCFSCLICLIISNRVQTFPCACGFCTVQRSII